MSDQNDQIATPDRRKVRQCFHVNLLKPYHSRKSETQVINPAVTVASVFRDNSQSLFVGVEDDMIVHEDCVLLPRLKNSETKG